MCSLCGNLNQPQNFTTFAADNYSYNNNVPLEINSAPSGVINALAASSWSSNVITYSFDGSWGNAGTGPYGGAITRLNAQDQADVEDMLQLYSNVIDVTFQEVSGAADIEFRAESILSGVGGYAYLPGPGVGGNVTFDSHTAVQEGHAGNLFEANQFSFFAAIHEIGHALGMPHPFSSSTSTPVGGYNAAHLNAGYSVMSYLSGTAAGQAGDITHKDVTGPQLYDIAALQSLYGANNNYNSGDTNYTFSSTGHRKAYSLWDGGDDVNSGGIGDTINAYNQTDRVVINLQDGDFLNEVGTEAFKIAYGATIENGIGGYGNDRITGNDLDNILYGGRGVDVVRGMDGDDIIIGGRSVSDGNDFRDLLIGGNGDDIIYGNAGNDTLIGGDNYTDPTDGDDILYGGNGDDYLYGNAGDDILVGGAGRDVLYGGLGDDTYVIRGGGNLEIIQGFGGGDVIRIHSNLNGTQINTYAELMDAAVSDGTHTAFKLGGHSVIVTNHVLNDFSSSDFNFV